MFNKILRVFYHGYNLFCQEKLVSVINIGIIIFVTFFIWFAFFSFYFFNQMIAYLGERLDFSIYFKPDIDRDGILEVQKIIKNFPGVKEVEFVPQETAFKKFQKEIQTNPVIARALKELQTNPLVDYLIVKADDSEVYLKISDYLEKSLYKSYIDYITYFENKKVIEKIILISKQIRFFISIFIIVILVFASLIILNTSLVSIYSQKEEIEILRLIGAGNWFIRGPFFVFSFINSLIGYILSVSIIIIFLMKTESFWPSIISNFQPSIFVYENFFFLNIICFGIILLINFLSTFVAIEKYLKK